MLKIDRAVQYMLLSTLSLSATGLLAKLLSNQLPIPWFSFLRFSMPALILLIVLSFTNIKLPSKQEFKPLLTRALCIGLCQLCFLKSLQTLSLVESVVLFATGPLFMPILERLFFKVRINVWNIAALIVTFVGVILLAGHSGEMKWRFDILLGIAGGIFNAGSQLALYRSSKSTLSPKEINFWCFACAAVFVLPIALFSSSEFHFVSLINSNQGLHQLLFLIMMALLVINTQVNRAKAYKLAHSGSQLAPLIFTNLVFSTIWQFVFFQQTFTHQQIFGLSLIVVATMTNSLLPNWLKKQKVKKLHKKVA